MNLPVRSREGSAFGRIPCAALPLRGGGAAEKVSTTAEPSRQRAPRESRFIPCQKSRSRIRSLRMTGFFGSPGYYVRSKGIAAMRSITRSLSRW